MGSHIVADVVLGFPRTCIHACMHIHIHTHVYTRIHPFIHIRICVDAYPRQLYISIYI